MTMQTRLSDLITQLGTDWKTIKTWVFGNTTGTLADLITDDKTGLIPAINEIKSESTGAPPDATESVKGVVFLADDAAALAMATDGEVLTPGNLGAIVNVADGLAKLDSSGKVASAQLPSFVDDVLEFADLASFPVTGESGKIYVALNNGKQYRWGGSAYAEISASPGTTDEVTEGATNLYFTNTRADTRADGRITALVGDTDTDLAALYETAKA